MSKPTTINAKKTAILIMCFSLIGLISGCDNAEQSTTQDIDKHLKRGQHYLSQGQFNAATIEARNIIQKAPDNSEGKLLLANIYLDLGKSKSAINLLSGITQPTADALFALSEAYQMKGKHLSNKELLTQNAQLLENTNKTTYLLALAQNNFFLKNNDAAQAALEQLLSEKPEIPDAKLWLARIAAKELDFDKSEQLINEVLSSDDSNIDALVLLASLRAAENDLAGAEEMLTEALAVLPSSDIITPKRARILSALADILTTQGRSAEALIYTRLLADAQPKRAELQAKFEEAINLFKSGNIDEAELLLVGILKEAPNHEIANQILGIIKYNKGELEAARELFNKSLDPETAPIGATKAFVMTEMRLKQPEKVLDALRPQINSTKDVQLLGFYGLAALAANEIDEGIATIDRALELSPENSRLRLALAKQYNSRASNAPDKALEQLKLAYQYTPEDTFIQTALVRQYIKAKQSQQAQKIIEEISNKYSENSSSLVLVGTYYGSQGNLQKSELWLNKALKITPNHPEGLAALGNTLIRLKKLPEATKHYQNMVAIQPNLASGYKGLISSYELSGQSQKGLAELITLTNNGNATANAILIEYYLRNGDLSKAEEQIELQNADNKEHPAIKRLSASLALSKAKEAMKSGDTSAARTQVMRGLSIYPNSEALLSQLAQIEITSGNAREASKIIDQIGSENERLATYLKGNLALANNQLDSAAENFYTLWKQQPSDEIAREIYAIHQKQRQKEQSDLFLLDWRQKLPNSPILAFLLGTQAIEQGNYSEAINYLQKLDANNNASPITLNNLAWAHYKSGNGSQALAYGKRAYDRSPESAAIADTYGWILYSQQQFQEAKLILKKAHELAPENKEIKEHWDQAQKK